MKRGKTIREVIFENEDLLEFWLFTKKVREEYLKNG